jgi:hypothetical protein
MDGKARGVKSGWNFAQFLGQNLTTSQFSCHFLLGTPLAS